MRLASFESLLYYISVSGGFSKTLLIIIVLVIALVGGLSVYFVVSSQEQSAPPVAAPTPAVKTTDMAPQLPNAQKTAVLVMHGDSSYEKFIVANSILTSFTKSLAPDDRIISKTPLQ